MKIVLWLPHLKVSGGVRVVLTYANQLAGAGHQIMVLTSEMSRRRRWWLNIQSRRPQWFNLAPGIKVVYVAPHQVPRVIAAFGGQVLIADSWLVVRSASALELPIIHLLQHDERLYHGDPKQVATVYQKRFKKIVVSTWLQSMIKKDFNQEAELLLNSFDRELFRPVPSAKIPDDKIRVLLLDHPYKWKGTEEGLRMAQAVKARHPAVVIMGLGARRWNKPAGFDEFYFSPPQSELASIYSRADIFLCPSWDEGFGLPSLEAMACATAVVTYDNGGSRDFAHNGETALVSPRRDEQSLKHNLERLIVDSELREKIAAGGLELTRTWPSWEEQAGQLEKILKGVITE